MAREVIEKEVLRERKRIRGLGRGGSVNSFDMRCDSDNTWCGGKGCRMKRSADRKEGLEKQRLGRGLEFPGGSLGTRCGGVRREAQYQRGAWRGGELQAALATHAVVGRLMWKCAGCERS